MSIQSEINRIAGNVANAYTVLSDKGATMPSLMNSENLAAAIESLQAGEAMSIETIWEICGYVPYDENTLLLLHGDDLSDSSKNGLTITNSGVVVSDVQSKFGGKSLYFNGSSRITFPAINFGSGDFTIDWWEYVTSSSSKCRFASSYTSESSVYGGLVCGYGGTNLYAGSAINNSFNIVNGTAMLSNTLNTWVHWAIVRNGTTLITYRNGVKFASVAFSGSLAYSTNYPAVIGDYRAGDHAQFIGYIDEFRISNIARWTANFTPPTEAY